jgi:glutathione S-transferase
MADAGNASSAASRIEQRPIVVYGRTSSSNTQKVLWALHEAELAYTLQLASAILGPESQQFAVDGQAFGVVDTPEYLAMNPTAKVPTLTDGDFAIFESNTICRYIARGYCTRLFTGSGSGGDGSVLSLVQREATASTWMDFSLDQHGADAASFGKLAEVVTRLPEGERGDPDSRARAIGAAAKTIKVLDTRLQAVASE